jgi:hypothetical protein
MPQGCEGVDKSGSRLRYALKVEASIDALRPPDSIVSVLVRAPIRYAGHAESKSGLITLLLQSPGALLWHRPAPEDVDYASGALCYSQCRGSIISCPKDSCKDSKGASQELVFEILHRSTVYHVAAHRRHEEPFTSELYAGPPPVAARQRTPMPTTIP